MELRYPTKLDAVIKNYKVFFSHGGEDIYFVKKSLAPDVEAVGAEVFLDQGKISYGDDFRKRILIELSGCDELLVLLTKSSINRSWVSAEIGMAIFRGIRVVAIQYGVDDIELHDSGLLSLLGTNNLLHINDFDEYLAQLRERVEVKS